MKLTNFRLKPNVAWTSVLANCDLRSLGFKTDRLAKIDSAGLIQVTIGSTVQGQACELNQAIVGLIGKIFPSAQLTFAASTNGNADKPEYPSFDARGDSEKLDDFFKQLESLILKRNIRIL